MAPEMQQRGSIRSSTIVASSPPSRPQTDPHTPYSIPPWVQSTFNSRDITDRDLDEKTASPLPRPQPPANYKPGRKWDQQRTAEPALLSAPLGEQMKRWDGFMHSGPNDQESRNAETKVVDQAWLDEHMPYLSASGWVEQEEEQLPFGVRMGRGLMYRGKWLISPERQEKTVRLFWVSRTCSRGGKLADPLQRLLLKNPYVPLVFRLVILAFSAASLGVAARIFVAVDTVNSDGDPDNQCATRASTYMAICVGAAGIPYVAYVTWDEYLSKPYVHAKTTV